jgi:hypothetical protein
MRGTSPSRLTSGEGNGRTVARTELASAPRSGRRAPAARLLYARRLFLREASKGVGQRLTSRPMARVARIIPIHRTRCGRPAVAVAAVGAGAARPAARAGATPPAARLAVTPSFVRHLHALAEPDRGAHLGGRGQGDAAARCARSVTATLPGGEHERPRPCARAPVHVRLSSACSRSAQRVGRAAGARARVTRTMGPEGPGPCPPPWPCRSLRAPAPHGRR